MKKKFSRMKGVTFVEAIISVSIFIFVLMALMYLYNNFTRIYNYQEAVINLSSSARSFADELRNSVLQANEVVASHDFSGTTYSSDQDTLVLKIPSIDGSGDIVDDTFDYVVFYRDGRNLYKLTDPDPESIRTSDLKQLSDAAESVAFSFDNVDFSLVTEINIEIQMQKMVRRQAVTYDLHEDIYLRNI